MSLILLTEALNAVYKCIFQSERTFETPYIFRVTKGRLPGRVSTLNA